ncbi:hypothetical protein ACOCJ5_17670, partial [Knoellia sp. CPCC 206450]|uniref:hypothetical protein n=1 Tax=Knoellia tibetensis TaxID=3404798 RepID=UPI003B43219C
MRTTLRRLAALTVAALALSAAPALANQAVAPASQSAVAAATPTQPGSFVSLAPARVLDTRTNLGATGPITAGGTARVTVLGKGGVPT